MNPDEIYPAEYGTRMTYMDVPVPSMYWPVWYSDEGEAFRAGVNAAKAAPVLSEVAFQDEEFRPRVVRDRSGGVWVELFPGVYFEGGYAGSPWRETDHLYKAFGRYVERGLGAARRDPQFTEDFGTEDFGQVS